MLEIGSLIDGKYKILRKIGQGEMSVVYLATDTADQQWAVKELRKDGVKNFEIVKLGLAAETEILKKLKHPNLSGIVDVIDTGDSFIIIMDYIQGYTLDTALYQHGAQAQESVVIWGKQLCDVLGYLHAGTPEIIYQDIKPSSIMLKPDGNVVLIDFGTIREPGKDITCLGTMGYAAPEQLDGGSLVDARTDIFCLGATLYHLVTGENPCKPPYQIKPIRQINPSLSGGLEKIIRKCTQHNPDDRYQSVAELKYALEHYKEMDDGYRKKQARKLVQFMICDALAGICAGTSIFMYFQVEKAGWRIPFRVSLILMGIMALVSVLVFFALRIPAVIGDLSGRTSRKTIEKMRSRIEHTALRVQRSAVTSDADMQSVGDAVFTIEYEITYVHSNEIIS